MDRVLSLSRSDSRARRRWARTVLVPAAVFSALSLAFLALAPAASSQEGPGVDGARARLAQAQADANATRDRYEKAVAERGQTQLKIDDLEQTISTLRAQAAGLRSQLARRAVALYKNSDASRGLDALASQDQLDAGRKVKLSQVADQYDEGRAQQLGEMADRLQHAEGELQRKRTELDDLVARVGQEQADLEQKVARANRGVELAEQLGPLRALGDPVMGPTLLRAPEMVAWYRSTGASPKLSGDTSIDQLAQMFVDEGTAENVRGDVAFAQAYIETGGFRAGGSDNNFSGLGACGGCGGQNRFPTALDGVRAQIQHLRNYADRDSRAAGLAHPPSPYWYGPDPVTAARNFDSFFAKGSVPTWQVMGHGNWAAAPDYASKVTGIYDRMVASAGGS